VSCVISMLCIHFYDPRLDCAICGLTDFYLQEIKFEPNVMCEPIDKKVTFRTSQVSYIHN